MRLFAGADRRDLGDRRGLEGRRRRGDGGIGRSRVSGGASVVDQLSDDLLRGGQGLAELLRRERAERAKRLLEVANVGAAGFGRWRAEHEAGDRVFAQRDRLAKELMAVVDIEPDRWDAGLLVL